VSKKKNRDVWPQRVQSLAGRIKHGRQKNHASQILFDHLVKEMRKEDGKDEIIADLIEKITSMFLEIDRALTHDKPEEKKV
jgi:hypothetical protein